MGRNISRKFSEDVAAAEPEAMLSEPCLRGPLI